MRAGWNKVGILMKIGIIGSGWYGCHLALALAKKGVDVTIFEKNDDIFSGVSGKFGIRLHKGPHYPRSEKTRESCKRAFDEFCETYPELVIKHDYATYALGEIDSLGDPPKVNKEQFRAVCYEDEKCQDIDIEAAGYKGLINAMNIDEPSIAVGSRLRETFRRYLSDAGVKVNCNYSVNKLHNYGTTTAVIGQSSVHQFDHVINATGYQALLPENIKADSPFEMEVVYQPCLALCYADKKPADLPFSFIVMDGWFPCVMPYIDNADDTKTEHRKYILTHGSYTIMASCDTPEAAHNILNGITDDFIETKVKPPAEHEINRFWPEFDQRFQYLEWKGEVLAKLRTKKEFRSAVTFASPDGVINIIPGKVSNVFDAEKEVIALIENKNCQVINGYRYVEDGVLAQSLMEITEKPDPDEPNTCSLNTYAELNSTAASPGKIISKFKDAVAEFNINSTDLNQRQEGPRPGDN